MGRVRQANDVPLERAHGILWMGTSPMAKRKAAKKKTPAKKGRVKAGTPVSKKKPKASKSPPKRKKKANAKVLSKVKKKPVKAKRLAKKPLKKKVARRVATPSAVAGSVREIVTETIVAPVAAFQHELPFNAEPPSAAEQSSTPISIPMAVPDDDFLPLWFGGLGLTDCFAKLNVGSVGELRTKTEADVVAAGGTQALVMLKSRIEKIQDTAVTEAMVEPERDDLRPASQSFAYFYKGNHLAAGGSVMTLHSHVCEIIHRPDSSHVTVRLGATMDDKSQDLTIPLTQIELVSRPDRRKMLQFMPPLELSNLVRCYRLWPDSDTNILDAILDYEFNGFVAKPLQRPKRVLVIDDDREIGEAIRTALVSEGYEVTTRLNGNDAVEVAQSSRPDLLIVDVMLPGESGFNVFEKMLNSYQVPRVIMISGSGDPRNKRCAEMLGVDDYLVKPFGLDRLIATVNRLLV